MTQTVTHLRPVRNTFEGRTPPAGGLHLGTAHPSPGGRERGGLEPFPRPAESGLFGGYRPPVDNVESGMAHTPTATDARPLLSPREVADSQVVAEDGLSADRSRRAPRAPRRPPAAHRPGRPRRLAGERQGVAMSPGSRPQDSPESWLLAAGFTRRLDFWCPPGEDRALNLNDAIAALESGEIQPPTSLGRVSTLTQSRASRREARTSLTECSARLPVLSHHPCQGGPSRGLSCWPRS